MNAVVTMTNMKVLIAILLTGCVGCGAVNRALLVTSTASLACDWAQTRSSAASGWNGQVETNPIMGSKPATSSVDIYFASAIAINAGLWLITPPSVRGAVPAAVTAVQANTVAGNIPYTRTVCGLPWR